MGAGGRVLVLAVYVKVRAAVRIVRKHLEK